MAKLDKILEALVKLIPEDVGALKKLPGNIFNPLIDLPNTKSKVDDLIEEEIKDYYGDIYDEDELQDLINQTSTQDRAEILNTYDSDGSIVKEMIEEAKELYDIDINKMLDDAMKGE